jgi:hypothetical protein
MTMKHSQDRHPDRRLVAIAITLALSMLALAALLQPEAAGRAGGSSATVHGARPAAGRSDRASFWPRPTGAPRGWLRGTIPSGAASVFHPASWTAIPGDDGTVTYSLRDRAGAYLTYLNVTPRQGAEQARGWARFRTRRNREEGAKRIRTIASAERLHFADATGSCVVDDYLSRVGAHPYRELACIVAGRRSTSVLVVATRRSSWDRFSSVAKLVVSSFRER